MEAKFEQYKEGKAFEEALKLRKRKYRSRARRPPVNRRSAPAEEERKEIHQLDLTAFFSEENSWRAAIDSLKEGLAAGKSCH